MLRELRRGWSIESLARIDTLAREYSRIVHARASVHRKRTPRFSSCHPVPLSLPRCLPLPSLAGRKGLFPTATAGHCSEICNSRYESTTALSPSFLSRESAISPRNENRQTHLPCRFSSRYLRGFFLKRRGSQRGALLPRRDAAFLRDRPRDRPSSSHFFVKLRYRTSSSLPRYYRHDRQ